MEVRLDAVGDKLYPNCVLSGITFLEVVLGKTYRNVVINGIQIKYVIPLMEFKKKQRESFQ